MRAMSISVPGSLNRSFMSGTRLWPPAIELAPAVGRAKLGERVVERRGAAVLECRRNHEAALPG